MIKKKRKHKKSLKHFFMGLLITIAVLAILFLIALKLFTVKRVVVEGNELYDQKTIEDAVLNDKYSWNSLYVYLKYKVKDTKKIPFIDTWIVRILFIYQFMKKECLDTYIFRELMRMHILIRMALWWRHPQTRCRVCHV